ncbi:Endosulfine-domain-containing protein [Basidiobolus meristosporus CBS 931.73]|uniref:mRNA stability protein n=1 Tax=Basidiobolus meristosporus CBS 931.73 TaxID=1314790 RepID=A0A1Y1WYH6_9FUNG|nr:Endosulfine-domain-containing protein [Basidiobolus meristosporus CBS 931.73]|eukprot:ORX78563.1 Endosulfine-domain-containing protein [Basidiobolus meristosporus CBS 931.73]
MLPAKTNKVDLSKLSPEELKIFKMYGRLPSGKDLLSRKLKDRKYFDSGDYALQKAGKTSDVGSIHPSPDTIPHPQSPTVVPSTGTTTQLLQPKEDPSQLATETTEDTQAGPKVA